MAIIENFQRLQPRTRNERIERPGTHCRERDPVKIPRWRSPTLARGDQAPLPTQPQEHRPISRISFRGRILQDLHGTSPGRKFIGVAQIKMGTAQGW